MRYLVGIILILATGAAHALDPLMVVVNRTQAREAVGLAEVKVHLDRKPVEEIAVTIATGVEENNAVPGVDFVPNMKRLVWAAGDFGTKTFVVQIIDDGDVSESHEWIPLVFTEEQNIRITGAQRNSGISIINNPNAPAVVELPADDTDVPDAGGDTGGDVDLAEDIVAPEGFELLASKGTNSIYVNGVSGAQQPVLIARSRYIQYEDRNPIMLEFGLDRPAVVRSELRVRTSTPYLLRPDFGKSATPVLDYAPIDITLVWEPGEQFKYTTPFIPVADGINEGRDEVVDLILTSDQLRMVEREHPDGHNWHYIVLFDAANDKGAFDGEPSVPEQLAALDDPAVFNYPEINALVGQHIGDAETVADEQTDQTTEETTEEVIVVVDPPVAEEPPVADESSDFVVLNTMNYRDPVSGNSFPNDMGQRTPIIYQQSFISGDHPANEDGTVSESGLANGVENFIAQQGAPHFSNPEWVIGDIEKWSVWPFVTDDDHLDSVLLYADYLDRLGEATGAKVCQYGIYPQAGIVHTNELADPDTWAAHSDVTDFYMSGVVDALCPTLYAVYADNGDGNEIERWRNFAIETIREARRIAPDKPVYPFIWPQFHQAGLNDYEFIPLDYWRIILETMKEHADGVVLWGGFNLPSGGQLEWDEAAPWIAIAREVLGL